MTNPNLADAPPVVVSQPHELRDVIALARHAGKRIGLVPTMGALHAGHLSLADASAAECGLTVVTIFVNPTQFGAGEDFDRYPRTLERDLELLAGHGVDVVFAPSRESIYRPGHATRVEVDRVSAEFEGRCRPGHFSGVATIVLKLLQLAAPDVAYFGQKDFQQCAVIRRMVEDLDVPGVVHMLPTVREPDGLAMSSRNAYLSPAERQQALGVIEALRSAAAMVAAGERAAEPIIRTMRERLRAAGLGPIDYAALVEPRELGPIQTVTGPTLALIATHAGLTRLIDNLLFGLHGEELDSAAIL
ncbi:MAG: pantoate--beta-alanine ligase [Planctomycetes bacterium]|nr:pantoate--beta-alanine ligase [Planctomycetota bacterium]